MSGITLEKLETIKGLIEAMRIVAGQESAGDASIHRVPVDLFLEFTKKHDISYYEAEGAQGKYYVGNATGYNVFSKEIEPEVEEVEMTLEEVAELKGVPVEKLRIKD